MDLSYLFKRKPTSPTAQAVQKPVFELGPQTVRVPVIIKPGKWVTVGGHIGIIASLPDAENVEVHFVDHNGETIGSLVRPLSSIKIAKHIEIPECRRHPDAEYAAGVLGYF
jgi:hypothetical protein